jgi:hypothetical protein
MEQKVIYSVFRDSRHSRCAGDNNDKPLMLIIVEHKGDHFLFL